MKAVFPSALAALFALLLSSCGDGGYRTDFPPPAATDKYSDVFPAEVGGVNAKIDLLPLDAARYKGAVATYGTNARVLILETKDSAAMDEYVKGTAVPDMSRFNNRSSAKVNGVWKFRGHGSPGRIHGWQNGSWLFVLEASSDALFDEAVSRFAFISKK